MMILTIAYKQGYYVVGNGIKCTILEEDIMTRKG